MTLQTYSVPFGQANLTFKVEPDWEVEQIPLPVRGESEPTWIQAPDDGFAAAVQQTDRAVIVFTDATRASPDRLLATRALRDLLEAGMPPDRISFLCAVGMHRPSTAAEKREKLGPEIVERFPVMDHDPAEVVSVGYIGNIPLKANHMLARPGTLIIGLGVVEPHQYAGYSGGAKTVTIGCAGAETIAATHSPRFLRHPGTRLGQIKGNPFQAFVREAGRRIGLVRVYNAVLDPTHQPRWLMGGSPDVVHDTLVRAARLLCEVPVPAPVDVVIAGVVPPKDANLYQASRAATYIGLSGQPVIRPGGVIILPAGIPEGAGQGAGEQHFIRALGENRDLSALMTRLEREGCQPGEQRAYMVAQLLKQFRVIVVGAKQPEIVKQAHLAPVDTLEEALELARVWIGTLLRSPRLLIVPDALHTLPVPRPIPTPFL